MAPEHSLVLELQRATLNPAVGIAHLLRVARMAATKLDATEMLAWIQRETAGYDDKDEIPDYRRVDGLVQFFDRYQGAWFNAEARDLAGQKLLDKAGEIWLHYPVSHIEGMTADSEAARVQWAGKAAQAYRAAMGGRPVSLLVSSAQLRGVIDRVRDAVADWSLRLEKSGIVGEGLFVSQDEKRRAAEIGATLFQTNFYGGDFRSAQIQQGTRGSSQTAGIDSATLLKLVEALRGASEGAGLVDGDRAVLDTARETIERQALAQQPDQSLIRGALERVGNLGGGILASYIANKYGLQIDHLFSLLSGGGL